MANNYLSVTTLRHKRTIVITSRIVFWFIGVHMILIGHCVILRYTRRIGLHATSLRKRHYCGSSVSMVLHYSEDKGSWRYKIGRCQCFYSMPLWSGSQFPRVATEDVLRHQQIDRHIKFDIYRSGVLSHWLNTGEYIYICFDPHSPHATCYWTHISTKSWGPYVIYS